MRTPIRAPGLLGLLFGVTLLLGACAGGPGQRSTGDKIDDASISARVKAALLADDLTDGTDIEIEIDRGLVQLNGFADSAEEVKQAEKIAKDVKGVRGVTNNLRIASGSRRFGEYVDDKVLIGRIKGALAKDPLVNSLSVEVEINRSVVMLGGFVRSSEEKAAAAAAARRVKGVREVVNNIDVRRSGS